MNLPVLQIFAPDSPYRRLASSLDGLPNRFPPAKDGSDLRLLACLFTPEQAGLAAGLLPELETSTQIYRRLGTDLHETAILLKEMSQKGLIAVGKTAQGQLGFGLLPFIVGIYENQNKRIDTELAQLFEDYYLQAFGGSLEIKPQVHRVIPVGESIPNSAEVMPYEQAGEILKRFTKFAVAPCICREEKGFSGESCGKPLETCLLMGGAAESYLDHLRAREITYEEAVHILEIADRAGLVLQPVNTQDSANFCCCCGDCCGVLRNVKRHPQPSRMMASAFYAVLDQDQCDACGTCLERCQMDAITIDSYAHINLDRCIGCGLCVTTCQQEAIQLKRKPENEVPHVPQNTLELYARVAAAHGVLPEIGKMALRSGMDRLRSR